MNPKSSKQAAFLKALAGDQKTGKMPPSQILATTPPVKPLPVAPSPMMNPAPVPVTHIPQAPAPKFMPPKAPMSPTAAPGLPAMGNLPKFGKMRNSLRGSPFNKSNKA